MPDLLRAEQIAVKVQLLLKGTTDPRPTTMGANVYRNRARTVPNTTTMPVGNVKQGEDSPLGREGSSNVAFIDSDLQIFVDLAVESVNEEDLDTKLNALRREVHIIMMGTAQLGLAFVHLVIPDGAGEPIRVADAKKQIYEMRTRWRVRYRHSINDASA